MKRFSLVLAAFLLFILFSGKLYSQNKEYVHETVSDLSSKNMHGRGYVKKGVNKAAKYLAKEMKSAGLKSFDKNYFQALTYDVNTFAKNTYVALNGKKLRVGYEYMPGPASPSAKGDYSVVMFDSINYSDTSLFKEKVLEYDLSSNFLVLDFSVIKDRDIRWFYIKQMRNNPFNAGGFIEKLNGNLVWSVRSHQDAYPSIKISAKAFPDSLHTVSIRFQPKLIEDYKTSNVIGYIPSKTKTEEYIVFTAHYDHLGHIGKKVYIPGANDNASGTSTVLDLANHYAKNGCKYNLAFMLFTGEEAGLHGSMHYVKNPYFPLEKIKAVINLDMVGTGEKGITVVNGGAEGYEEIFNCFDSINNANEYLPLVKARGEAANSDHYPFHMMGAKAVFIYTMGGKTYYHHPEDKPETVSLSGYEGLFNLITDFVNAYE